MLAVTFSGEPALRRAANGNFSFSLKNLVNLSRATRLCFDGAANEKKSDEKHSELNWMQFYHVSCAK